MFAVVPLVSHHMLLRVLFPSLCAAVAAAAGLRIKENKEVYEGEVTELTPEFTESEVSAAAALSSSCPYLQADAAALSSKPCSRQESSRWEESWGTLYARGAQPAQLDQWRLVAAWPASTVCS